MPKLKTTRKPEDETYKAVLANVKYWMAMCGISMDEAAVAMRMTTRTLYKRMHYPETFAVKELVKFAAKAKIAVQELFENRMEVGA